MIYLLKNIMVLFVTLVGVIFMTNIQVSTLKICHLTENYVQRWFVTVVRTLILGLLTTQRYYLTNKPNDLHHLSILPIQNRWNNHNIHKHKGLFLPFLREF